jgi:glycine cleavage system aminomethyltransferase T
MNSEFAKQIVATYEKHGWKLRRLLAASPTQDQRQEIAEAFPAMTISEAEIDALWFARSSHAGREAWEIRLVAEPAYALFEAFESDESEEDREDARREMENKMREYSRG